MKLVPMNDRVILKRVDAVTKSTGGIIIPDSATERPVKATVVAVGPLSNADTRAFTLEPGDVVLVPRGGIQEMRVDEEVLIVMKHEDVLAVYQEETPTAA